MVRRAEGIGLSLVEEGPGTTAADASAARPGGMVRLVPLRL